MGAATERIVCRALEGGHHPKGVRRRHPARKSLDRGTAQYPFCVNPETDPPQPSEVAEAIADVLESDDPGPDPWWQAGIEESLESDGGAAPA